MRILLVNKFNYRRGGAETVFLDEKRLLEQHGHEVVVFAMEHEANEPSPYERHFVSNVELRETNRGATAALATAGRLLYSRDAASKIDALIRETRPEIAHLHNIYHQLSPSILRPLARHGVPTVMTLHDYKLICPAYTLYSHGAICERCQGGRYYNALLQGCVKDSRGKSALCAAEAYLHSAMGLYRRNVRFYVSPSRFLAAKVVQFGIDPRRVVHIPNFVEPDAGTEPPSGGGSVVYAGRIEKVKGVRTLVDAFAGLAAEAVTLLIAGDGEHRGELEAYCASRGFANVRFLGHLAPDRLATVLDDALFVVVPSEWYENAPLSVLEAAARGKAVVVSDLGGLPELVRDGETGAVFPAGDISALAAAMGKLLADPGRTAEMGRNARTFVQESFGADGHYEALMGLYSRAVAAR